jgi:hypothetical protein
MARKKPKFGHRLPERDVLLGIAPYRSDCSRIGVMIQSNGEKNQTVIPPDGARYLARDESNDAIRTKLLKFAEFIDNPPEDLVQEFEGQVEVVPPTLTGPEALRAWLLMHREFWQAAYLLSQQLGWSRDVIVTASPQSERLDDSPLGFDLKESETYRREIAQRLPSLVNPFAAAPQAGYFHVFATEDKGRFQGSLEAFLAVPEPGAILPSVILRHDG